MLVPNTAEISGPNSHQARLDSRDLAIMEAGGANYGVASGGAVTAQGSPNGTVAVAAASLVFSPPGASQVNITIPTQNVNVLSGGGGQAADGTNPRIDLIVVNSAGVVSCLHGTAAAVTTTSGPLYPTRTAIGQDANGVINQIILARVDVRAGATTVVATDIVDKRFFPQPPLVPPIPGQDATIVYPGQLTQTLVTNAGPGSMFVLKAGVHTYISGQCTPTITPLDNQTFIGEPGAILDGAMITNTGTVVAGTAGTSLVISGYTLTAGVDDQTGTVPTWVAGFAFNNNADARLDTVVNGTTATLNDTMSWTTTVTDGVITGSSPSVLTSATSAFTTARHLGADVQGTGIPANTTITAVNSATSVNLSNASTNASGLTVKFTPHPRRNTRVVTDGVTTGTTTLTSATANFGYIDLGAAISGTNIPANTSIREILSPTSVRMNNTASGSGSSISVTIIQQTQRIVTLYRPPAAGIDSAFKGTAKGITLRNLIIQNYATVTGRGAVHPQNGDDSHDLGDNWVIEDCELRYNSSMGLRSCHNAFITHNRIHSNGNMGNGGGGHCVLFEGNEVYFNNTYNHPLGFDSCAMKFAEATALTIARNRVHDNIGLGIWNDVNCFGVVIEKNDCYRNLDYGIAIETCYNTDVIQNNVWGNGLQGSTGSFYDPGNILISSSSNVEVKYNIVGTLAVGDYHGIGVLAQDRRKVTSGGALRSVSNAVTNSTVTVTSATAAFTQADLNAWVTGTNIPAGPPVTTIVKINSATSVDLSVAASGGTTGTLNIQRQPDQFGALLGVGQATGSGWYQRLYNVNVHHNMVTTTGTAVQAAGMVSDIANAATTGLYFRSRGIRFHSNTYHIPSGVNAFAWGGAAISAATWQTNGQDQVQTQVAPTGPVAYNPATESLQEPPDVQGTQWAWDNLDSTTTSNISGSATIDLSGGFHKRLTVTANVTALTISNIPQQGEVVIEFINNGTFTRVNTATNMRPAGAAMAALTSGAGKTDVYTFVCNGTSIIEKSRSLNC